MTETARDDFFETLPAFAEFSGVADAQHYRPLPADWALATADIVSSTGAIARGEYKAVNMAGRQDARGARFDAGLGAGGSGA